MTLHDSIHEQAAALVARMDSKYRLVKEADFVPLGPDVTSFEVRRLIQEQVTKRPTARCEVCCVVNVSLDDITTPDALDDAELDARYALFDEALEGCAGPGVPGWVVPEGDPLYDEECVGILFSDLPGA